MNHTMRKYKNWTNINIKYIFKYIVIGIPLQIIEWETKRLSI